MNSSNNATTATATTATATAVSTSWSRFCALCDAEDLSELDSFMLVEDDYDVIEMVNYATATGKDLIARDIKLTFRRYF